MVHHWKNDILRALYEAKKLFVISKISGFRVIGCLESKLLWQSTPKLGHSSRKVDFLKKPFLVLLINRMSSNAKLELDIQLNFDNWSLVHRPAERTLCGAIAAKCALHGFHLFPFFPRAQHAGTHAFAFYRPAYDFAICSNFLFFLFGKAKNGSLHKVWKATLKNCMKCFFELSVWY